MSSLVRSLTSSFSSGGSRGLDDALQQFFFTRLHLAPLTVYDRALLGPEGSSIEALLYPPLAEARGYAEGYARAAAEPGRRGDERVELEDMAGLWKYRETVAAARLAVLLGVHPRLIEKGTSGSYFVTNRLGKMIGVFKPRSEEPYAYGNPKWPKHVQRICCPCAFGRDCLVLNNGYLSEAGASVVDRALHLAIVPRTEVIEMSSPVFNNILKRTIDLTPIHIGSKTLPIKTGSFQTFLHGFSDAGSVLARFKEQPLADGPYRSFIHQFQRLIILDFVIRNTDRNTDNWLIKVDDTHGGPEGTVVTVRAIDNGLAFPIKHPDGARKFPFQWGTLPYAREVFLPEMKVFADRLADVELMEDLMAQLYLLFKQDPAFTPQNFEKQMGVMLGQARTLAGVIKAGGCPADLLTAPEAVGNFHISALDTALARIKKKSVLDMVVHPLVRGFDGTANTPPAVARIQQQQQEQLPSLDSRRPKKSQKPAAAASSSQKTHHLHEDEDDYEYDSSASSYTTSDEFFTTTSS